MSNLYIIEQYLLFFTCFEVEATYWDTMSLYDFDPVSAILSFLVQKRPAIQQFQCHTNLVLYEQRYFENQF